MLTDENCTSLNADNITSLIALYIGVGGAGSFFVAGVLEEDLKARAPATRPYRWGFFLGCMEVATAPFILLTLFGMLTFAENGKWERFGAWLAYTIYFVVLVDSGWFIIKRKRWAWVVGTICTCNIILWAINYAYSSKRWGEFAGQLYGSAGTADEGYELLHDATKLETRGRVLEALAAYQRVAHEDSHTAAGADAQKSIESLRARID